MRRFGENLDAGLMDQCVDNHASLELCRYGTPDYLNVGFAADVRSRRVYVRMVFGIGLRR